MIARSVFVIHLNNGNDEIISDNKLKYTCVGVKLIDTILYFYVQ
jgi:hypothetical protein